MGQAGGRARAGLSDPRQPATGKRPGLGCQAARGHVNCLLPPHSLLQPVRRGTLYPRQWPLWAHGDLCSSLRIADPRYRRDLPPPGKPPTSGGHRPEEAPEVRPRGGCCHLFDGRGHHGHADSASSPSGSGTTCNCSMRQYHSRYGSEFHWPWLSATSVTMPPIG